MLNIQSLSGGYGDSEVLRGVRLEARQGEVACLVGANGAGKSTIMKAITGFLPEAQGKIEFNGEDLLGLRPEDRVGRGLALCPEGREVFATLTVEENLRIGARCLRGKPSAGFDMAYSMFPRLAERRRQAAGTLSGGEQQMLAIARALMSKPKLLMLDEPSMGLAPNLAREVFAALAKIKAEGVAMLVVEQRATLALGLADRAYVMRRGRVGPERSPSELLGSDELREAYTE